MLVEKTNEDRNEDAVQRAHENRYIGGHEEIYHAPTGLARLFCEQPDRLAVMFHTQSELQDKLGVFERVKESPVMMQHYVDKMLLAIHEETVEIARETMSKDAEMPFGWKHTNGSEEKYKEEIIDLWHFLMNLWLITGATDQEFFEMYLDKNNINHERQESGY